MKLPFILLLVFSALVFAQTPQSKSRTQSNNRTKTASPKPQLRSDFGPHKLTDAVELPSADIDCDGKPERVVMGTTAITRTFFIGGKNERHRHKVMVFGLPDSRKKFNAVTIPFIKDTGYYGFCGVPQKDAAEVKPLTCEWDGGKLPGCDPAKRCEAVSLKDACIDMIVFWDTNSDRLSWARKAKSSSQ